ncbi:alpha/beta fold hydrolase [Vitiosangium sp. GDMCC 1.1324]|uniref:alpha/beta fold hydrolase n=1 Tax=Vitiosangium sp. (strain GDMCC 1.1324) TaxID=2138576 RepID=UPI000D3B9633|nr:alpha/beta fold hydrolase [Vitiosangium sp. GDMCC 1.1324]PTL81071.1 alpha/beta hydrolase [Vitiosangium sp. GDMCC 1.1324]
MGVQKQEVELFSETLRLAFTDEGEGRPFLLLHGGAGPASMSGLGGALAKHARAIIPTHPGFNGQPRPDRFARIDDLVLAYLSLLERLDLRNVVVVGNSVGGWIAAELALRKSPRIAGIVLLNAVGIDTGRADRSIVDPMKLAPAERSAVSFHNPARFAFAPSGPEAAAAMAHNQQTLRVYAGEPFMHEPTLRSRLAQLSVPALVAWGESDRIVDVDYGQLYAHSMPGARFERLREAGHFPQIEQLDEVVRLIGDFSAGLR